METDDETRVHLELELIVLKKLMQKINRDSMETQKRYTAEEFGEFFRERIRYCVSFYSAVSDTIDGFHRSITVRSFLSSAIFCRDVKCFHC